MILAIYFNYLVGIIKVKYIQFIFQWRDRTKNFNIQSDMKMILGRKVKVRNLIKFLEETKIMGEKILGLADRSSFLWSQLTLMLGKKNDNASIIGEIYCYYNHFLLFFHVALLIFLLHMFK